MFCLNYQSSLKRGYFFLCSTMFPLGFAFTNTILVADLWVSLMAFRWTLQQRSCFKIFIKHFSYCQNLRHFTNFIMLLYVMSSQTTELLNPFTVCFLSEFGPETLTVQNRLSKNRHIHSEITWHFNHTFQLIAWLHQTWFRDITTTDVNSFATATFYVFIWKSFSKLYWFLNRVDCLFVGMFVAWKQNLLPQSCQVPDLKQFNAQ